MNGEEEELKLLQWMLFQGMSLITHRLHFLGVASGIAECFKACKGFFDAYYTFQMKGIISVLFRL